MKKNLIGEIKNNLIDKICFASTSLEEERYYINSLRALRIEELRQKAIKRINKHYA